MISMLMLENCIMTVVFISEWPSFITKTSESWYLFHVQWLTSDMCILVVRYEDLKADLKSQIYRIGHFLGVDRDRYI